ncbi:MAG TPA: ATP-binding protein, partial [Ktedonobacterales bacterium]
ALLAQTNGGATACQLAVAHERSPFFMACYDASGSQAWPNQAVTDAPKFIRTDLAQAALNSSSGMASAIIDGGDNGNGYDFQHISTYLLVVRNPVDRSVTGVLQVGLNVEGEVSALDTLLHLELLVGLLTIGGASWGGYFLAKRSLEPAKLALAEQQRFVADASHELRTPLTLLRADAEVLLRGSEHASPETADWLHDIVSEVTHMERLTDHLLTLARLDTGKLRMERDVVDLAAVAGQVEHRSRALAAERQIALSLEAAQPTLVIGDRALLEELTLILVDNALKYTPDGGSVTLLVTSEGSDALLSVRDTGIGISSEHLSHLGERFYRVDKARSRETGGAGLGLSIAHGIAGQHGGTLTLTSQPGEGTAATLRLAAVGRSATQTPVESRVAPEVTG